MTKEISAKSVNEAIGTIVAKLCYQVADEVGESLGEKTSRWRQENALSILEGADEKVSSIENKQVHPRIMHRVIEDGSWCDDETVREMWSGLLASSCTETGKDDSNLLFINTLNQLSTIEVKILKYVCDNSKKYRTTAGWIGAYRLELDVDFIVGITGVEDVHRLDRELDHLRALELIDGGFESDLMVGSNLIQ